MNILYTDFVRHFSFIKLLLDITNNVRCVNLFQHGEATLHADTSVILQFHVKKITNSAL